MRSARRRAPSPATDVDPLLFGDFARNLAAFPSTYDRDEAYARYKSAREASFDLLIALAPKALDLLTSEQKRLLGANSQYLDLRYLRSLRSSTVGR
jgi:hypothetical protein